jgi:hypothetical protein
MRITRCARCREKQSRQNMATYHQEGHRAELRSASHPSPRSKPSSLRSKPSRRWSPPTANYSPASKRRSRPPSPASGANCSAVFPQPVKPCPSAALQTRALISATWQYISPGKAGGFTIAGPSKGPGGQETPHPPAGRSPGPLRLSTTLRRAKARPRTSATLSPGRGLCSSWCAPRTLRLFPSPLGRGGTARRWVRGLFPTLGMPQETYSRSCQTSTASPAEPRGRPTGLRRHVPG